MTAMRDRDPLAEVLGYLAQFRATGDPRPLLGEQAYASALRLAAQTIPDPQRDPDHLRALAQLLWLRAENGQGPHAERDRIQATHLFHLLGTDLPDLQDRSVIDISGDATDEYAELESEVDDLWHAGLRTGNVQQFERVIELLRQITETAPPDHPRQVEWTASLAIAIAEVGKRTRNPVRLNTAVALLERVNSLAPRDPTHMSRLSVVLQEEFELTGELELLDRAVDILRTAVQASEAASPDFPVKLGNLGAALWTRGRYACHTPSLDEAIQLMHDVLDHPLLDPMMRPGHLSNLGNALRDLGELTGDTGAIREAIDIHGQALAELENSHSPYLDAVGVRMNLAITLLLWYERAHNPAALSDAVAILQGTLEEIPPDHFLRARVLCCLGNALEDEHSEDQDARRRGVQAFRDALTLLPTGSQEIPRVQSSLAAALLAA